MNESLRDDVIRITRRRQVVAHRFNGAMTEKSRRLDAWQEAGMPLAFKGEAA
jgi:hypothetical protein